jgi:hypothetical protein
MTTGAIRGRGRVAGLGAIASIAAAAVAGCGAASSGPASGTASPAAPSSAAASPGTSSAAAAGGGGSADASGAVQLAAKTASSATSVTGTMSVQATVKAGATASPGASAGATGSAGSGNVSLSGTFSERIRPTVLASVTISSLQTAGSAVPGGLSEVLTPSTLYLKAPALTQPLHIAKPWLSIPLAKLSQSSGIDFSQILSTATNNGPLAQSQLLAGATSVQKAGTTTLNGVPVTEYTGTIDLSKAAAALSGNSKSQLQQAITKAGLSTATFTVWIDGQHVTRKAVVHETGKTISETVTTTITGINQPVNIAVPSAAQTAPLPTGSTTTS